MSLLVLQRSMRGCYIRRHLIEFLRNEYPVAIAAGRVLDVDSREPRMRSGAAALTAAGRS